VLLGRGGVGLRRGLSRLWWLTQPRLDAPQAAPPVTYPASATSAAQALSTTAEPTYALLAPPTAISALP
jgi:hypothetical protein